MSNKIYNFLNKDFFKKDITVALILAFIFSIFCSLAGFDVKCEELRDNILRLHIIANSDSEEDQALKLKVRDEILKSSEGILETVTNKNEAIAVAKENTERFRSIAQRVIKESGKDYSVEVSLGKTYFTTRKYENFTLPAGEYEALRVLIGKAEGKNWWCVMFPSMCIPAAGKTHTLNEVVNDSAAEVAENPEKYEIKFKSVEIYENIKEKIGRFFL